jgi:Lrp/AsnC family transcriptional regulator, leucine-responsive regulatory protein
MYHTLDDDDVRILQLLQHNARLTNKEIGDKIGKSASPVFERIRRLRQEGFIKQFTAVLDNKMIEKNLVAFTNIHLRAHAKDVMLRFEQEVIRYDEVMECYHMTGEYDFLLKIAVKDMDEYYNFVIHKLARLSNVGTVQSFFVLNASKCSTAYELELAGNKRKKKVPTI